MATQRIVIPYSPRAQFQPFHGRGQRWAAMVAHRRAGKTVAAVNDLIRAAITCPQPNPRFAYLAPFYAQAKDVAWGYLKQYTAPIPGVGTNESELRVDLPNGGRVRLYGADNYDRLRGIYLDGVVLDEYADMDPKAWSEVIRPALSDRKGWATFIGTPKGQNAFYDLCEKAKADPDWFFAELRASQTGIVAPDELAQARREMTREQYAQEYECSFEASVVGAYYADELDLALQEERIGVVPYDPAALVRTYWDLGLDDATAVWFVQLVGKEIRLLEYQEWTGAALTQVAAEVHNKPYAYEEHVLPHDAEVREMTTAVSRRDALGGILGAHRITVAPRTGVEDGINAVRVLFSRMWFDKAKCKRGLECLRNYRKAWNEKRKTFDDKPYHDWSSHGSDALRMLGVTFREQSNRRAGPIRPGNFGVV